MTARTATGQRAGPRTPDPVRLSKNQRQHLVAKLLAQHAVTSQDQLVVLLAAERVTATQATVSRDLDDLGAIKVRADRGEPVYAIPDLPKDQRAPDDLLRRTLSDWVVEVASSANLVVLRTPPGTANVVGAALDRAAVPGVLGTVAGDDTLLVVADDGTGGRALASRLRGLAGLT